MACGIPETICYFSGQCEYQNKSMTTSVADLNGDNVCFDIHANYRPDRQVKGGVMPFTIFGDIIPQEALQSNIYPPVIPFNVTGKRKWGKTRFHASGTVGLNKHKVNKVQIDIIVSSSSDIVDVEVSFPCEALLKQRIAR